MKQKKNCFQLFFEIAFVILNRIRSSYILIESMSTLENNSSSVQPHSTNRMSPGKSKNFTTRPFSTLDLQINRPELRTYS